MELLSPRDRRTLLIGSVSIGAIVALAKVLPAARRWQAAQIARARVVLEREATAESAAGGFGAARDSAVERARRLGAVRGTLVGGATPTAAAAALASLVERVAASHEVDVATVTLGFDSTVKSGLALVSVRVTAESDVRGLVGFLYAVETDRAPLVVRELSLMPGDAVAPASGAESIRLEAVIQSLAAVSRPAAAPPRLSP